MKLARPVEEHLPLAQPYDFLARADVGFAPVNIHHLPEIVRFTGEDIARGELKVMQTVQPPDAQRPLDFQRFVIHAFVSPLLKYEARCGAPFSF